MSSPHEEPVPLVLTASLTSGVVRVTRGLRASAELIEHILRLDHVDWETTLSVGDAEFRSTKDGPYPNHQMRVSARPMMGYAALNYIDHDDPKVLIANSYNS